MQKIENKRFQGNDSCIFYYDYKKESSPEKSLDKATEFAGECKKLREAEGIRSLFYREWDQGCIWWTYNTIPEKTTLPLHGRKRIQELPQYDSILDNTKF